MDLCFITEPAGWGGTELHTVALIDTLIQGGYRIWLIVIGKNTYATECFSRADVLQCINWPVLSGWHRYSINHWSKLLKAVPNSICIQVKGSFGAGCFALDVAIRGHFKEYFTIEHLIAPSWPRPTFGQYFYGLLPGLGLRWYVGLPVAILRVRMSHRVICVSHAVRERIVKSYFCSPAKTMVIQNAIDVTRYRYREDSRRRLRTEWELDPRCEVVFGSLGRLNRVKGYDIAIAAVASLIKRIPKEKFQFVLFGDGPECEKLRELARRLGCFDSIIFRPATQMAWDVYSAFDFFVMPSRAEGLPLTLLEAMACECIPIASRVDGIPEVITSSSLGWLVPSESSEALTTAMEAAFLCTAESRMSFAGRARAHIESYFNKSDWEKAFLQLIEGRH